MVDINKEKPLAGTQASMPGAERPTIENSVFKSAYDEVLGRISHDAQEIMQENHGVKDSGTLEIIATFIVDEFQAKHSLQSLLKDAGDIDAKGLTELVERIWSAEGNERVQYAVQIQEGADWYNAEMDDYGLDDDDRYPDYD
jgi:hypothetical protein